MSDRSTVFLQGLQADNPVENAAALAELTPAELAVPEVFAAAFRLARSDVEVPGRYAPKKEADPFASFFGDEVSATAYTLGEMAIDRIMAVTIPGSTDHAGAIAVVLGEADVDDRIASAAARLLGSVAWQDQPRAVRAIAPPLIRADKTLFEALPGLQKEGLQELVDLALDPYVSRTVQELLNHPVAGEMTYKAIQKALMKGTIEANEVDTAELLSLLSAWSGVVKGPARVVAKTYPWAVAFEAFDDPDAGGRFAVWLQTDGKGFDGLAGMIERAALSRPGIEGFPLQQFLEWCDGGCAIVKRWKWTGHVVPLLVTWVQQWWEDGERGERAWEAILLLLQAGEHGPVSDIIAGTFERTDDRAIPWDRDFFTLIAEAQPPVEGLTEGLVNLGLRNPDRIGDVVPALSASSGDGSALRRVVEPILAKAEAAEWRETKQKGGVTLRHKQGFDVQGLEPLVQKIGDDALQTRLDAVWPKLLQG